MTDEATRLARLEEQVKGLTKTQDEFRDAFMEMNRDIWTELKAIHSRVGNGEVMRVRLDGEAQQLVRLEGEMAACRRDTHEKIRSIEDFISNIRGKYAILAVIIGFLLTAASGTISAALV